LKQDGAEPKGLEEPDKGDITELLHKVGGGDDIALEELASLVYRETRQIAARLLRGERDGHTLQPTALANEAFGRLLAAKKIDLRNSGHLFATVTLVMRHILVDYARKRRGTVYTELEEGWEDRAVDYNTILIVDEQLALLAEKEPRAARVFEMRWFGGVPVDEIAKILNVTDKTVQRDFLMAQTFLTHRLRARARRD
jgi:RNA polymerase sigma factor (TIGR02999 family)